MGYAKCRFNEDKGCNETGSQEWYVHLADLGKTINVPSMWKHYMQDHLVQPMSEERRVIMATDSTQATGEHITTRGSARPAELMVLYVERTGPNQYTHQIGEKPDTEFIDKLESILENVQPLQTKGIGFRPGYR
ncbi:hypothetical protein CMI38_02950 [Candidatus Pacearchaeota archaeon]|nr:hypothetical protein [Candidatus Pacearchaeota archaeon]|tara:strand:- start:28 stop:429 length:402 start_codon:yes stop_codon:yes gene_type:complete